MDAQRDRMESDLDAIMVGTWMLCGNGWSLIWTLSWRDVFGKQTLPNIVKTDAFGASMPAPPLRPKNATGATFSPAKSTKDRKALGASTTTPQKIDRRDVFACKVTKHCVFTGSPLTPKPNATS